MIEINEVQSEELKFSIRTLMPFLQDIFDASEIIILTARKKDSKTMDAGFHTFCANESVIEGMLMVALDAFNKAREEKESDEAN